MTSFLNRDTQVSRRFYDFFFLNTQFLSGEYFAFSAYPMKKRTVPIDATRFPWPETTKIRKSPNVDLSRNFAMSTMWRMNSRTSPQNHHMRRKSHDQLCVHLLRRGILSDYCRTVCLFVFLLLFFLIRVYRT